MNEESGRSVVARWETPSAVHWVEMYRDRWGYGYTAPTAGGSFGKRDFDQALAELERMISCGCFQPGKRPVQRVI